MANWGIAVAQLEEVKKDRHVQVFFDFGVRWDSRAMSETLARVTDTAQQRWPRSWPEVREAKAVRSADISRGEPTRSSPFFCESRTISKTWPSSVRRAVLDLKLVSRDFKGVALVAWDYWQPAMKNLRQADPFSYSQFERLVGQMRALPDE